MIDIVEIKSAATKSEIKFYVEDGFIYCSNTIGESVIVGIVDKSEDKA